MAPPEKSEYVTVEVLRSILNEILDSKLDEKLKCIVDLQNENKNFEDEVCKLEIKVNVMENYTRNNNVIIQGLPFKEDENPVGTVIKSGELVWVNFNFRDIDIAQCLRSKSNKMPPTFILKLVNCHQK